MVALLLTWVRLSTSLQAMIAYRLNTIPYLLAGERHEELIIEDLGRLLDLQLKQVFLE